MPVSKSGTPRPTVAAIRSVELSESTAGAFCLVIVQLRSTRRRRSQKMQETRVARAAL